MPLIALTYAGVVQHIEFWKNNTVFQGLFRLAVCPPYLLYPLNRLANRDSQLRLIYTEPPPFRQLVEHNRIACDHNRSAYSITREHPIHMPL
ncbi:hypothetical protein D3C81_1721790 [compost metagenome]